MDQTQSTKTLADLTPERKQELLAKLAVLRGILDQPDVDWALVKSWLRFAFLFDEDQIVLQGHTILERVVPNLLNAKFLSKCNFRDHFRDYANQLRLCFHLGLLDSQEYTGLAKLSRLRNSVAHGTHGRVSFADEVALRRELAKARSLAAVLAAEPTESEFPGSLKYLIFIVGIVLDEKCHAAERLEPLAVDASTGEKLSQLIPQLKQLNQFSLYGAIARALMLRWRDIEGSMLQLFDAFTQKTEEAPGLVDQLISVLRNAQLANTTPAKPES